MNQYLVECCANSIKSAMNGEKGGANRIEFCENLEAGGVTPSRINIKKIKGLVKSPLHVLIRPRIGSFIYTKNEHLQMIADIQFCKIIGCEGIVVGALHKNGSINIEQTRQMVKTALPMHVTFHRAFDEANNLEKNLEDVIACGCETLLTSGQEKNVNLGFNNLKNIVKLSSGRINILAGSGVNHKNIKDLYKIGIRHFHLSGKKKNKTGELETDTLLIKSIIDKIDQIV